MLAVNIAYMTSPGARWIALSYSSGRFEHWWAERREENAPQNAAKPALVSPKMLWQLESVIIVDVAEEEAVGGKQNDFVHRPKILHYLYVLVRTDVVLKDIRTETKC